MNEVTSLQVAPMIAKLFAAEALPVLRDELILGQLVNTDYSDAFANGGDTIQIGIAPSMVANDIGETGAVLPQNPAYGMTDLVLNRHKEATFMLPDVTKILTRGSVINDYTRGQLIALAEALEDELMGQILNLTANTPLGAAGVPIGEALLDTAETTLFQAKIPSSVPKVVLFGPTGYSQARQVDRFSEVRMIGGMGETIRTGKLPGELKGFVPLRSNRIPVVPGSPATNYNIAFAPAAITMAMRRLPPAPAGTGAVTEYAVDPVSGYVIRFTTSYNANQLALQVTADILFGTAVLRPEFAVQLLN